MFKSRDLSRPFLPQTTHASAQTKLSINDSPIYEPCDGVLLQRSDSQVIAEECVLKRSDMAGPQVSTETSHIINPASECTTYEPESTAMFEEPDPSKDWTVPAAQLANDERAELLAEVLSQHSAHSFDNAYDCHGSDTKPDNVQAYDYDNSCDTLVCKKELPTLDRSEDALDHISVYRTQREGSCNNSSGPGAEQETRAAFSSSQVSHKENDIAGDDLKLELVQKASSFMEHVIAFRKTKREAFDKIHESLATRKQRISEKEERLQQCATDVKKRGRDLLYAQM